MDEPDTDEATPGEATQSEAEAQSEETVMPWIWGAVGLIAIACFVAWLILSRPFGHIPPHPPGAAPLTNPPSQRQ